MDETTLIAVVGGCAGAAILLGLVGGYVIAKRRAYADVLKLNPYGAHMNSAYGVDGTGGFSDVEMSNGNGVNGAYSTGR